MLSTSGHILAVDMRMFNAALAIEPWILRIGARNNILKLKYD